VGDAGITSIAASGNVDNLQRLSDFDGNYTAAGTGLTVAGGGNAAALRNQNGVTVDLVSGEDRRIGAQRALGVRRERTLRTTPMLFETVGEGG
jgi:hypothetical protein